jgi:membrane associated rhomboid family serine protease
VSAAARPCGKLVAAGRPVAYYTRIGLLPNSPRRGARASDGFRTERRQSSMGNASHTIREELRGVLVFVGVLWAVFLVDLVLPIDLTRFGLVPRTLRGAFGILTMPFLHASLGHLLSNTLPLLVVLMLLAGSKARSWEIVAEVILLGGVLLWLFGRSADHVGASALLFGLVTFLIVSGLLERRVVPLLVAVAVGFLYGGSLISGILPTAGAGVSWDGHLSGAIAGAVVAFARVRAGPAPERPALS